MQRIIRFPRVNEAIVERVALESFPIFSPVILDDDGLVAASNLNPVHASRRVGVALKAGIAGERTPTLLQGIAKSLLWSWDESKPIFLGDRSLVQVPPPNGFLLVVGLPSAANSIFLNPEPPIIRG